MRKTRLFTVCFISLQGALACGTSESEPIFDGDDAAGEGGEGPTIGGTGGNDGSGGNASGRGGSTATGGSGTGGGSSGSSGTASGGTSGEGGASDGGSSGSSGAPGTGGSLGDGGMGGGGGMCPDPAHPNVSGTMRTCNSGFCYCADDDGCYPDAVASSCCTVPVVCGPDAMNPVATINHPSDGEMRAANESIPFVGVATDPQDGALTDSALVWTSSELSAPIGAGLSFDASLPADTHVITLTATDSDSNTGTDTITLTVQ